MNLSEVLGRRPSEAQLLQKKLERERKEDRRVELLIKNKIELYGSSYKLALLDRKPYESFEKVQRLELGVLTDLIQLDIDLGFKFQRGPEKSARDVRLMAAELVRITSSSFIAYPNLAVEKGRSIARVNRGAIGWASKKHQEYACLAIDDDFVLELCSKLLKMECPEKDLEIFINNPPEIIPSRER